MRKAFMILLVFVMCGMCFAEECIWERGPGGWANWSDPNNWCDGKVPSNPNDIASFPEWEYSNILVEDEDIIIATINAGNYTQFRFVNSNVEIIYFNSGTTTGVELWSGFLSIDIISGGHFLIGSGTFIFNTFNFNSTHGNGNLSINQNAYIQGRDSILGDFNSDGFVNLMDLSILAQHWLETTEHPE